MATRQSSAGPNPFWDLPALGAGDPPTIHAIVDTPKGSRHKYKYDEALGLFRLERILAEGLVFPFNFGYIPSTMAEDGDPLDVVLLMDEPAFVGCLVPARLIGVIEAEQVRAGARRSERNDRLAAVPARWPRRARLTQLRQVEPDLLDQAERFFVAHAASQGKRFTPLRRGGARRARQLLAQGIKAFESRR
jgi:inorganic pyrophosphatase